MSELIDREALKAAYKAAHKGEPGGAWKLICEAPAVEVPQWISVKERIPEYLVDVLVCTKSRSGVWKIEKGYYAICDFIHEGCWEVTYWMPLPIPPEEEIE